MTPDYAKDPPTGAAKPGSKALILCEQSERLRAFMQGTEEEAQAAKKQLAAIQYRAPNQHVVQAYDHALQGGLGLSLHHFVVQVPPGPLKQGQLRYFVPASDLPGWRPPFPDEPERKKSCISDLNSPLRRWVEVPTVLDARGRLVRPTLHTCTDLGTIGAPSMHWYYQVAKGRGTYQDDILHTEWNIFVNSLNEAGLKCVLLERALVQNLPSGPYKGAAFHSEVKKQGLQFVTSNDATSPLFLAAFDHLCQAADNFPDDYGSLRHREEMWARLANSPHLRRKGVHCRVGRWYHVLDACDDTDAHLPELLVFLSYIGIKDGYWATLETSPIGMHHKPAIMPAADVVLPTAGAVGACSGSASSGSAGASHSAAAAMPSSSSARVPVALSNTEIDDLRKKAKNSMDLACRILANTFHYRILQGVRAISQPFRATFARAQTMLKTRRSTLQHFEEKASRCRLEDDLLQSMRIFRGGELKLRLGFLDVDTPCPAQSMVSEDQSVGQLLFDFACRLCGKHVMQNMKYSDSVPGMFLLLKSPDEHVVKDTLKKLKTLWELVVEAERIAHIDAWVRNKVKDIVILKWPWIREQFLILAEFSFKHAAREVVEATERIYLGMPHTLLAENGFNELNQATQVSRKKDLCRKMRWHRLTTSPLVQDFDRTNVQATVTSRSCAAALKVLPSTLFDADVADNSLGMDVIATISSDRSWTSPSAESWHKIPLFFARLVEVEGNWALMKKSWMASLLNPGAVLIKKEGERTVAYLVLLVSTWGTLLWRLEAKSIGTFRFFTLATEPASSPAVPWCFFGIDSLRGLQAAQLHVPAPVAQANISIERRPGGLVLQADGSFRALTRLAAERSFVGMMAKELNDLLKQVDPALAMTDEMPTTEKPTFMQLLHILMPEKRTAQELEAMWEVRHGKRSNPMTSEITEEVLATIANDFIEEADREEFETDAKKYTKPTSSDSATVSAGVASEAPKPKQPRKTLPQKTILTREFAAQFMPKAKGCSLGLDMIRHYRWTAEYNNKPKRPFHHCKTFGDESVITKRQALLQVLRWTWEVHCEVEKCSCPWDLSA